MNDPSSMTSMADANRLSQPLLTRIGRQVRRRRKKLSMTVQRLADLSGLSRRMVTQVELGQANPSLTTVDRIAAALGVDFATLIQDGESAAIHVNQSHSNPNLWTSESGGVLAFHVATAQRPAAELWEGTLPAGSRLDAQPDPIGSEVLVYVFSGTLTIAIGETDIHEVRAGWSAHLKSDRAHSYVNSSSTPARFVRVFRIGDPSSAQSSSHSVSNQ